MSENELEITEANWSTEVSTLALFLASGTKANPNLQHDLCGTELCEVSSAHLLAQQTCKTETLEKHTWQYMAVE